MLNQPNKMLNIDRDSFNVDRFLGAALGAQIGDCLGMHFEFSRKVDQGLSAYTGVISELIRHSQYQGARRVEPGQGTDDTEMAMALMSSINENGYTYNRDATLMKYMEFASMCTCCGENTRYLFKGIKTVKTYDSRWQSRFQGDPSLWTQSNGALMRAYPLVLLINSNTSHHAAMEAISLDTALSNPGPWNWSMTHVYTWTLRQIISQLGDHDSKQIENTVRQLAAETVSRCPEVSTIMNTVLNHPVPCVTGADKGWAQHALHISLAYGLSSDDYQTIIEKVIRLGGDTDTNGAIAGAIAGARIGMRKMIQEPLTARNIAFVQNATTEFSDYPREGIYRPSNYNRGLASAVPYSALFRNLSI